MSGSEIMAVVGFFVMLFGFAFGIWKYIDGKITSLRLEAATKAEAAYALAAMARSDLAEYKTHVAESYVTKQGLGEQTQSLLRAIESLGTRIDSIVERIDNIIISKPTRRP